MLPLSQTILVPLYTLGLSAAGSPLTGSKRPQVDTIMSSDLDKLEIDKNATKELEILQGLLGHIGAQNKRSGATFSLDLFDRNSNTLVDAVFSRRFIIVTFFQSTRTDQNSS